ncbi:MAG: cardiolipin synthase [Erysipelotrichales bacterium]|nr:cardiolipin synthase [Erysipelotrichales bacterium]
MRKIVRLLTSKALIVTVLILLQVIALCISIMYLASYYAYLRSFLFILSLIIGIQVINHRGNPSYKIAWIIVIMAFPLFGGIFYVLFGNKKMPKKQVVQNLASIKQMARYLKRENGYIEELKAKDLDAYKLAYYLEEHSGFPLYTHCDTTYLSSGEMYFECLLSELKKAKKYIFMEYFIIEEGIFFTSILEVLHEKVSQGVEVYFIYDDAGCVGKIPPHYDHKLQQMGIHCLAFNPIEPQLLIHMNHRDHRKITVIDGKAAFTGGVNLADEYINAKVVYGKWVDSGIMIQGEAVWAFALMFMQFYNFYSSDKIGNYDMYYHQNIQYDHTGYILPYTDSPLDEEIIGENVHISILNMAKQYVYIKTPYLICDHEVMTALQLAAKMGIDVRIMLPHIPDKWFVHMVSRAYYTPLIEAGVKILEYEKGFIHSKEFISDDRVGVIGSTNMDYRSYYLHHECGVWLYDDAVILEMKRAYEKQCEECIEIDIHHFDHENIMTKMIQGILRLFSPIM